MEVEPAILEEEMPKEAPVEEVEPVEKKDELPSELPEAETAPPPEEPLETETPAVDTESEIMEKEITLSVEEMIVSELHDDVREIQKKLNETCDVERQSLYDQSFLSDDKVVCNADEFNFETLTEESNNVPTKDSKQEETTLETSTVAPSLDSSANLEDNVPEAHADLVRSQVDVSELKKSDSLQKLRKRASILGSESDSEFVTQSEPILEASHAKFAEVTDVDVFGTKHEEETEKLENREAAKTEQVESESPITTDKQISEPISEPHLEEDSEAAPDIAITSITEPTTNGEIILTEMVSADSKTNDDSIADDVEDLEPDTQPEAVSEIEDKIAAERAPDLETVLYIDTQQDQNDAEEITPTKELETETAPQLEVDKSGKQLSPDSFTLDISGLTADMSDVSSPEELLSPLSEEDAQEPRVASIYDATSFYDNRPQTDAESDTSTVVDDQINIDDRNEESPTNQDENEIDRKTPTQDTLIINGTLKRPKTDHGDASSDEGECVIQSKSDLSNEMLKSSQPNGFFSDSESYFTDAPVSNLGMRPHDSNYVQSDTEGFTLRGRTLSKQAPRPNVRSVSSYSILESYARAMSPRPYCRDLQIFPQRNIASNIGKPLTEKTAPAKTPRPRATSPVPLSGRSNSSIRMQIERNRAEFYASSYFNPPKYSWIHNLDLDSKAESSPKINRFNLNDSPNKSLPRNTKVSIFKMNPPEPQKAPTPEPLETPETQINGSPEEVEVHERQESESCKPVDRRPSILKQKKGEPKPPISSPQTNQGSLIEPEPEPIDNTLPRGRGREKKKRKEKKSSEKSGKSQKHPEQSQSRSRSRSIVMAVRSLLTCSPRNVDD